MVNKVLNFPNNIRRKKIVKSMPFSAYPDNIMNISLFQNENMLNIKF